MVLLALSIIVIPDCYVTGDGPSHTYNAKVWFDYLFTSERTFYKPFYQLNKSIEPNWMSHILLGVFTRFLKPMLADKVVQVCYVTLFAYGFRSLIHAIRDENRFLSYLFFPFVFTLAFQQGFYNYSFAIAFMFWSLSYFLRNYQEITSVHKAFNLFLLLGFTILSHGMIAGYTLLLIVALWIIFRYRELITFQFRMLWDEIRVLTLISTPLLLLLVGFLFRTGLDTVPHALTLQQKAVQWSKLYFLMSTKQLEFYPLLVVVLGIVFGFFYALFRIRTTQAIGILFLLMAAYTTYSYLCAPHSIGGAGSIDLRLAFLPLLFLIFFLASIEFPDSIKTYSMFFCFALLGVLLAIRFPSVLKASDLSDELLSCRSEIRDQSVVLNLHMDDAHHLSEKEVLFEADASFIHLTDYLGAYNDKHLILLNNYEADLNYFPVQWRPGMSPRFSAPGFNPGNYPPCDSYQNYEKATGTKIDYILLQNWNSKQKQQPCVQALMDSILIHFNQKFVSSSKHLLLFERRTDN